MADTTDTQASELPPEIPEWVDIDILISDNGGSAVVEQRAELAERATLLVHALARVARQLMPIAGLEPFGVESGEVFDAVCERLGFDRISYVDGMIDEIGHYLQARYTPELVAEWEAARPEIFSVVDPPGWFDLGLGLGEGVAYAMEIVAKAGGTVTWSNGDTFGPGDVA